MLDQRFSEMTLPGLASSTSSTAGRFTASWHASVAVRRYVWKQASSSTWVDRRRQDRVTEAKRLRVAVVTQHFPSSQSQWIGHSAYQTLLLLAERCDVHLFFPQSRYPRPLERGVAAKLDAYWRPYGIPTTYVSYPTVPFFMRPFNGHTIAARHMRHDRRYTPDIVLSYPQIYPDGFAAVRMAHELGVPAVVTAIGSDLNRIPDAFCRMLTRSTLRDADFVSAVSQDLCNTAQKMGADPDRSDANLNGCNTALFHARDKTEARKTLGIDPDGQVIVYVGRLDYRKGLIELVDAMGKLLAERPSLRCYIVGDGADKAALVKAIARNNAAESIILIPPCHTEKVAVWMSASDLVTLPSYAEGCPNAVVEALSSGRPVVATNVGGIPELVNDTCGRLVPSKDVPALTAALDTVLSETWDADAIVARQSRSWTQVADQVYRTLVETLGRYLDAEAKRSYTGRPARHRRLGRGRKEKLLRALTAKDANRSRLLKCSRKERKVSPTKYRGETPATFA